MDSEKGLYFVDFLYNGTGLSLITLHQAQDNGWKLIQLYRIKDEKEIWHDICILEKEYEPEELIECSYCLDKFPRKIYLNPVENCSEDPNYLKQVEQSISKVNLRKMKQDIKTIATSLRNKNETRS